MINIELLYSVLLNEKMIIADNNFYKFKNCKDYHIIIYDNKLTIINSKPKSFSIVSIAEVIEKLDKDVQEELVYYLNYFR